MHPEGLNNLLYSMKHILYFDHLIIHFYRTKTVLKVSYRTAYAWKTRAEILCQEISKKFDILNF